MLSIAYTVCHNMFPDLAIPWPRSSDTCHAWRAYKVIFHHIFLYLQNCIKLTLTDLCSGQMRQILLSKTGCCHFMFGDSLPEKYWEVEFSQQWLCVTRKFHKVSHPNMTDYPATHIQTKASRKKRRKKRKSETFSLYDWQTVVYS